MFKSVSTSFIVRGLLAMGVGVVALAWPGVTVLALVIMFALYAFVAAGVEAAAAFSADQTAGTRALLILGGLVSVAFGVVLFAHPAMGVVSLALVFGLFNLISGSSLLIQGIEIRSFNSSLRSLTAPAKELATT